MAKPFPSLLLDAPIMQSLFEIREHRMLFTLQRAGEIYKPENYLPPQHAKA